jgi:hypothetical protein
MADFFDAGKFGAVVGIPFAIANAVTNAAAVDLAHAAGSTYAVMPVAGSVVGISASSSANVSAGSVTFQAHSASTEFTQTGAPAPVLSTTASNATWSTVRPGAVTFAAGARVGLSYTSTTDAAPTDSNDYTAILWVQLNPN